MKECNNTLILIWSVQSNNKPITKSKRRIQYIYLFLRNITLFCTSQLIFFMTFFICVPNFYRLPQPWKVTVKNRLLNTRFKINFKRKSRKRKNGYKRKHALLNEEQGNDKLIYYQLYSYLSDEPGEMMYPVNWGLFLSLFLLQIFIREGF